MFLLGKLLGREQLAAQTVTFSIVVCESNLASHFLPHEICPGPELDAPVTRNYLKLPI
jgi:hypothetical protein